MRSSADLRRPTRARAGPNPFISGKTFSEKFNNMNIEEENMETDLEESEDEVEFNEGVWALSLNEIPGNQEHYANMANAARTEYEVQQELFKNLMKAHFFEMGLEARVPGRRTRTRVLAGKRLRELKNVEPRKLYVLGPRLAFGQDEYEDEEKENDPQLDVLRVYVVPHMNTSLTKVRVKFWDNSFEDYRMVSVRMDGV